MNNQEIYKRVRINWEISLFVFLILAGLYVFAIFSYIHQWGNNPASKTSALVVLPTILSVSFIFSLFGAGRFIVKIDDNSVIVRTDIHKMFNIRIVNIKNVNIEWLKRAWLGGVVYPGKKKERIHVDFVKQMVSITVKSGKVYQIACKDAQKIKEEIEKRMITNNIISS